VSLFLKAMSQLTIDINSESWRRSIPFTAGVRIRF